MLYPVLWTCHWASWNLILACQPPPFPPRIFCDMSVPFQLAPLCYGELPFVGSGTGFGLYVYAKCRVLYPARANGWLSAWLDHSLPSHPEELNSLLSTEFRGVQSGLKQCGFAAMNGFNGETSAPSHEPSGTCMIWYGSCMIYMSKN